MKKILVIILGCIILGLTSCAMNVVPQVMSQIELAQDKVEWISNDSRSAITTLDEITVEIYKVPSINGKYIHDEKELLETRALHRGEKFTVLSAKDYDYKYITCIRCVEFNFYQTFGDVRNEINFFDYGNTIGMETVHYYGGPIKEADYEGWSHTESVVYFRDSANGYAITYNFLDKTAAPSFYNEYKDGGMTIWHN